MGRIVAIDYGTRRVGIAVTDTMQMISSPLTTVEEQQALQFLQDYCEKEDVETVVVGLPLNLNGEDTHATGPARNFGSKLKTILPDVRIDFEEEQFTSRMAAKALVEGGMKKKNRRKKENVDKVSAAIILQSYLKRV